jgi:hypothetical protein
VTKIWSILRYLLSITVKNQQSSDRLFMIFLTFFRPVPGKYCKMVHRPILTSCNLKFIFIITPWNRVLEKPIVTQLVKKLPVFYGT